MVRTQWQKWLGVLGAVEVIGFGSNGGEGSVVEARAKHGMGKAVTASKGRDISV